MHISLYDGKLKGALSDFCQTMLIFENTPLFWNLRPIRTNTTLTTTITETKMTHKHIQTQPTRNKAKSTLHTDQEETTQPRRLIRALLSTALIFTRVLPLAWSKPFFLMFCSSDIFLFCYLPSLSICSGSANTRPVLSNWALSSLYQYKTHPLTADWLQVCFGTLSDTVVKAFLKYCLVHL